MFNQNIKTPVNIPVSKIHPFEGNPYKVLDNDEMNTLICSIQEQGILTPIIIRPIENTDEYEVISGHRRLHAIVKAGMKVNCPKLCGQHKKAPMVGKINI